MLAILCLAAPAYAAPVPSEQAVKAAFLSKFGRYVSWPAEAMKPGAAPLTICIIGENPFQRLLDEAVAGQQIDQRPLVVVRTNAAGAGGCHIAFVHGTTSAATAALLVALEPHPVLTVTDGRLDQARGMIHFVVESSRVRFHIDNAAASRSGVAISSRLLSLAASVKQ